MLPGGCSCQEGGLVAVEVAAILSLEEDRGDKRGGRYVTTTRGVGGGGRVDGNTGSGSA